MFCFVCAVPGYLVFKSDQAAHIGITGFYFDPSTAFLSFSSSKIDNCYFDGFYVIWQKDVAVVAARGNVHSSNSQTTTVFHEISRSVINVGRILFWLVDTKTRVNITQCDFESLDLSLFGNSTCASASSSVITISHSSFRSSWVEVFDNSPSSNTVFIFRSVQFVSSHVLQHVWHGFQSFVFQHCVFEGQTGNAYGSINLLRVCYALFERCHFGVRYDDCTEGCAVTLKGVNMKMVMSRELEMIRNMSCSLIPCDGHHPTFTVIDSGFDGPIRSLSGNVIHCNYANLYIKNSDFRVVSFGSGGFLSFTIAWSGQKIVVENSTFDARKVPPLSPLVTATGFEAIFAFHNLTITCGKAFTVIGKQEVFTQRLFCEPACQVGEYSEQSGKMTFGGKWKAVWGTKWIDGVQTKVAEQQELANFTVEEGTIPDCFPCPVGGNCSQYNVQALPNYWGFRHGGVVTMLRCPAGYCCSGQNSCRDIDSCNTGRAGRLCGACKPNFTQLLFSATCVPTSQDCQTGLILFLYVLFAFGYAFVLLFASRGKDAIVEILKNVARRKKSPERQVNIRLTDKNAPIQEIEAEEGDSTNKNVDNTRSSMKYMQILFYYIQDSAMFKIDLPSDTENNLSAVEAVVQFSPDVLQLYSQTTSVCLMPGFTEILKVCFSCFFGPLVMLCLCAVFLVQRIVSCCGYQASCVSKIIRDDIVQALLLAGLFSLQKLVRGMFSLVHCVHVGSTSVLYIYGELTCYTWWQNAIQAYIFFNVFPITIVLSIAPLWVERRQVSVKLFLLCCLCPLPMFIYLSKRARQIEKIEENLAQERIEESPHCTAVVHILLEHFKVLEFCGLEFTWCGIHMLYRFVLIVCNTYITEPIVRLSILTSILTITALANIFLKPYKEEKANKTATLSYVAGMCIAALNFCKAMFATFDCKSNCSMKHSMVWLIGKIETVLLQYIPVVLMFLFVCVTGIQKCCHKKMRSE